MPTMPTTKARYLIKFDRIGRRRTPPDLNTEATSADDLAAKIHRYARKFMLSRDIHVHVELDEKGDGKGHITAGVQSGGTFTVETITEEPTPS